MWCHAHIDADFVCAMRHGAPIRASSSGAAVHAASATPYMTMRPHELAVRSVAYHPRLPLFASSSDDGTIHVYHGRVHADLNTNALIVPLKILRGHKVVDQLGVLSVVFHPTQPWLFSAGASASRS